MNIMLLLDMARQGFGERVAVETQDGALTYDELFEQAVAAGARFRESGLSAVGHLGLTSAAVPVALFGAAHAGLPYVPLNYRLGADELRALAGRISPAVIITDDDRSGLLQGVPDIVELRDRDLIASGASGAPAHWADDGDAPAVTLFTSGTTGTPKAAVLRHRHLVAYILGSVEFMGASPDEAALVSVPPYHIAAIAGVLSSVYAGRRIVQLPSFDADAWIDLANEHRVTHAMVVPTMLQRIVDRLDQRDVTVASLRALSYGGGKMARSTIERALELMPTTGFVNAYGLTETSSTIALLDAADHRAAYEAHDEPSRRRLVSVGRPLPGVEVSIRDPAGSEVASGERGEVWVRGEQVAGEYAGRGSTLDPDGWFHTNDEGWIDDDGYLFIVGRLDDVIVRGGENISPGEIEAVLASHPGVADVACVGIPDDHWGEIVVSAVVPASPGSVEPDELQAFARERLRSNKVPTHIEIVEELVYSAVGKLQRRDVRNRLMERWSDHTSRESRPSQ